MPRNPEDRFQRVNLENTDRHIKELYERADGKAAAAFSSQETIAIERLCLLDDLFLDRVKLRRLQRGKIENAEIAASGLLSYLARINDTIVTRPMNDKNAGIGRERLRLAGIEFQPVRDGKYARLQIDPGSLADFYEYIAEASLLETYRKFERELTTDEREALGGRLRPVSGGGRLPHPVSILKELTREGLMQIAGAIRQRMAELPGRDRGPAR